MIHYRPTTLNVYYTTCTLYLRCINGILEGYTKGTSQLHLKGTPMAHQRHPTGAPKVHQRYTKGAPKVHQGYTKRYTIGTLTVHQRYTKGTPKVHQSKEDTRY